ncbi:pisatin demethylase [Ophiostoma piceae UAMH 11346]|uniref:Pisatin demethylase n=1 Tax=Ophiostoma piceae (strain UAMH 11346) TaxID=1262450 RepID=S3CA28_OPHP1|nr:pisatin demethylase [Ophiostoma piceae UAMH 11346]
MIAEQLIAHSWQSWALIFLGSVSLHLLRNRFGGGLNSIPGPPLAAWTDLWRLCVVWKRRPELAHVALHETYGSVVRLGPRTVSVGDIEAVKVIYGLNAGFVKSIAKGHALPSLFNTTDEKFHAKLRRAVSNAYAMSTLVGFEPFVDSTTTEFVRQLRLQFADRCDASGVCDFGSWLQYYAFDVIGELTYSKRLGFVDRGVDVDQIIGSLEWLLDYVAVIGQMPFLDWLLIKNPIRMWMSKRNLLNTNSPVVEFAKKRMAESALKQDEPAKKDFLTRFKDAHAKDPRFISTDRVLGLTVSNMFAGSDTTAITLRAVFYNLLKNPSTLQKLLDELSEQQKQGRFKRHDALVQWEEVRDLPYLGAVINEALRCHPAVGITLERIVPSRGITVADHFIPGGTIVGCSAWVLHRNESVFGPETEKFRPERWLEGSPEQRTLMGSSLFSFGAGARTCIGKNISLLEIYKLVPAILRTFETQVLRGSCTMRVEQILRVVGGLGERGLDSQHL